VDRRRHDAGETERDLKTVQLISLPVSPFAARVRIALRAKGLDAEIVPPPAGWPHNTQYRDISPMGRVPALLLDDGETIWESAVIVEALEDLFPNAPPLLPREPLARARARLLVRCADLYLMPPMVALAGQADEQEARRRVEDLLDALNVVDRMLEDGPYAVGGMLTIADCALAPVLFASRVTGERLGIDLAAGLPALTTYAAALQDDQHIAPVLAEMEEGLRRLVRTA
jgi:glutathione S-transferase